MSEREWDPEELAEFERPPSDACRCGGDMPGRCPGSSNCPMCRAKDEETSDDDA